MRGETWEDGGLGNKHGDRRLLLCRGILRVAIERSAQARLVRFVETLSKGELGARPKHERRERRHGTAKKELNKPAFRLGLDSHHTHGQGRFSTEGRNPWCEVGGENRGTRLPQRAQTLPTEFGSVCLVDRGARPENHTDVVPQAGCSRNL